MAFGDAVNVQLAVAAPDGHEFNGNTITVQADNDPAGSTEYTKVTTINLTDATTYQGSTTKAAIVVGAYVIAEGTVSSDGTTLTATSVGIGGPGGRGGHGGRALLFRDAQGLGHTPCRPPT